MNFYPLNQKCISFFKVMLCLHLHVATPTFRTSRPLPQMVMNSNGLCGRLCSMAVEENARGHVGKCHLLACSYPRRCLRSSSWFRTRPYASLCYSLALEIRRGGHRPSWVMGGCEDLGGDIIIRPPSNEAHTRPLRKM